MGELVSDWMTENPVIVKSRESLTKAGALMAEYDIGAVLIGDARNLTGILTDSDIVRKAVAQRLVCAKTQAATIMTPDPITVSPDEGVREAMHVMERLKVRRLPVVTGGDVVGVITLSDVLKALTKGGLYHHVLGPAQGKSVQSRDYGFNEVGGWMREKPVILSPYKTTLEAAEVMALHSMGCTPVLEEDTIKGILTDTDIVRRVIALEKKPEVIQVFEVMTPHVVAAMPKTDTLTASNVMVEKGIKRLPVVEAGRIVGVISARDMIYAIIQSHEVEDVGEVVDSLRGLE